MKEWGGLLHGSLPACTCPSSPPAVGCGAPGSMRVHAMASTTANLLLLLAAAAVAAGREVADAKAAAAPADRPLQGGGGPLTNEGQLPPAPTGH